MSMFSSVGLIRTGAAPNYKTLTRGLDAGGAMLHAQLAEENLDVRALKAADLTAHMHMLFATARVNGDVRDALQCLRFDGYQTGLLCRRWHIGNTSSSTPAQQRTKGEMKRHFNGIVESEERGLDRLDPACYLLVAQRAGLEPNEIIYVDTRKELLVRLSVGVSMCVCVCLPACLSVCLTRDHRC
jgi:FMN phosphatase YigB (HAD superfamily)